MHAKQAHVTQHMVPRQGTSTRWIPPPTSIAKLKVGGTVYRTSNRGTISAICRNINGDYLGASALVFQGVTDPTSLEALACREAMALAADLVQNRIVIASDCKQVVVDIEAGT